MTPEDALEHCFKEIEAGRNTIADCVARFPDQPELEAQLKAALALRAWQTFAPRPEAARRIEARLRQEAQSQRAAPPVKRRMPARRWAMAVILAALLLSGGIAVVASNSLPGDTLYSMKRTTEAVQLFFTPPSGRAALHATLAQRRLDELAALTAHDQVDPDLLTELAADVTTETQAALAAVGDALPQRQAEVLEAIVRETEQQQTVLQTAKDSAPPEAQAELLRALEASGESQALAVERIEEIESQAPTTASPTPPSQSVANSPTPPGVETATPPMAGAPVIPPSPTETPPNPPTAALPGSTPGLPTSPTEASTGQATQAANPPSTTPTVSSSPTPPPTASAASATALPSGAPSSTPTPIPPGQAKKTATVTGLPTVTQPAAGRNTGNGQEENGPSGGPGCADNPNSPGYCTPTPTPSETSAALAPTNIVSLTPTKTPTTASTPTPCPTNASGKPKCRP